MPQIIQVKATVKVPRVPNFLITENGSALPLSAFTTEGLRDIAREWTENLIDRANEQREEANAKD